MQPLQIVELLTLAAVWGASFLFMRIAAPELGPIWLIEFRVLLAGLTLLPLLLMRGLRQQLWTYRMPVMVVGILNSAIPFSLLAFTTLSLPAGTTSILNGTVPFFGVLVAYVWLHERLFLSRIIGLLLGFAGVVVLVGLRETALTPAILLAIAAGLCAALMYAICAPFIRLNLQEAPSLVIATGSQLSAALVLLPLMPFTQPEHPPSFKAVLAVVGLAILCTSLAYILYFRLIHAVGSTRALTVTYLIPLFAMLWGTLILKEAITLPMIIGGALVLLGTAIANQVLKLPFQPHPKS
ncbi:DMT family transporter [Oscillatoria sp. CS-180]|uniref:DMT family transporter n=1 Tax=Oscillatoria sp. CS-180 TaxID=3021720 RepID=UPI00232DC2CA|nr:DMT family transporter [Oscillatoria sp. CS-180]MDB9528509.1 DMT family transporter [Oscillatoria sp. CS-180]